MAGAAGAHGPDLQSSAAAGHFPLSLAVDRLERTALPFLVLAFAALAALSWRAWPDLIVDFGQQAYVAWQLADGAVLYRDVAWIHGPLSAYWNALWFALAGPSLTTLYVVNLALLVLFLVLIERLVRAMADSLTALAATSTVLVLFAFAQINFNGNYNFAAPYSHEATHGLMCGFAAVAALDRAFRTSRRAWFVIAGVCAGLAMLTKLEMALAGLLAPVAGIAYSVRFLGAGAACRALALFAGGVIALLSLAFTALALTADSQVAATALAAPWRALVDRSFGDITFFRQVMGLDDPLGHVLSIAAWSAAWAVAVLPAVAAAFLIRSEKARRWASPLFIYAAYALALLLLSFEIRWLDFGRPLPVIAAAVGLGALVARPQRPVDALTPFTLAAFAFLVISKMLLNPGAYHYGFVLALPATVLAVVVLLHWLPRAVVRRGGRPELVRAAAFGMLLVPCAYYLGVSANNYAAKTQDVAVGGDRIRADAPRAAIVQQALDELAKAPADQTLVVLPDGVMLNYLARHRNPTPYVNFMPTELRFFGGDTILAAFVAHPPDRIALVHKDTSQWGVPYFGRDFGEPLMRWVRQNYEPDHLFGDPPLEPGSRFGIALLSRKPERRDAPDEERH